MNEAGKALVIGQLLPEGEAGGAVRMSQHRDVRLPQSHYWEQSRPAGWIWAPRPPVSDPPSPVRTPSLSTTQDHPPPLIYYQLHYLFMHSSLTCARLWCSSFCGGCVLLVFFKSIVLAAHMKKLKFFSLSPPEPFKRFYRQEHLMDVTPTWRVYFKF